MELNDIVEWRGNYYHLRAINDYNLSNGECKLQLLGPILGDILPDILPEIACDFDYTISNTSGDIVRDGLIVAYDWTSYNTNGTLSDRSSNGIPATYYGNLVTSSNALQFDGTSSFFILPTASFNPLANSWSWTIDTYGDLVYVANTETASSGPAVGWVSNIIAANYGNDLQNISLSGSTDTPVWSWGIVSATTGSSSDTNFRLRGWNQLTTTVEYDYTASGAGFNQYSYLGQYRSQSVNPTDTSFVTQSVNSDYLINQNGSGTNTTVWRTYKASGEIFGPYDNGQLVFGGPWADRTYGSVARFRWNPISGSFKYIAYYNRPLSEAELATNNCFYQTGLPIPQAALTPTTTTTLAPTTTTTASPTTTTTASPTTTIAPTTTTTTIPACLCYYILNETGGNLSYEYDDCQFGYTSGNLGGGANIRVCSSNYPSGTGLTIAPCVSQTGCTISGDCVFCT
jgi:hypothetical protein